MAKSSVAEAQAEASANSNTDIATVSKSYSGACLKATALFIEMLNAAIAMLIFLLNLIDSMRGDLDEAYEKQPPLPPWPPFPKFPSLKIPTLTIDFLGCPIVQCLGFPKLPSFTFPSGLPEFPTDEMISQFKEYGKAMAGMGPAYGKAIGNAAMITARNAMKALSNLPQAALNMLADSMLATLAAYSNTPLLVAMDNMISCLVSTDPAFGGAREIVLYKALRSKFNVSGKPSYSTLGLAAAPLSQLKTFKSTTDALQSKATEAQSLING